VHRCCLHAWSALLGWEVLWRRFLWRFDWVLVLDAVLVAASWLWCVEAGLNNVSDGGFLSWEVNTYLNEILALRLGDERLKLGCGKRID
jgi:hypothetical protein